MQDLDETSKLSLLIRKLIHFEELLFKKVNK